MDISVICIYTYASWGRFSVWTSLYEGLSWIVSKWENLCRGSRAWGSEKLDWGSSSNQSNVPLFHHY